MGPFPRVLGLAVQVTWPIAFGDERLSRLWLAGFTHEIFGWAVFPEKLPALGEVEGDKPPAVVVEQLLLFADEEGAIDEFGIQATNRRQFIAGQVPIVDRGSVIPYGRYRVC